MVGEMRVMWVWGAPGGREVGREQAVGTREEVLVGRLLDDSDEGA